jgi:upstream activation factor subunit UAF30
VEDVVPLCEDLPCGDQAGIGEICLAKNSAFMKPVQPDEILGEIVGHKPLPRTEITKKVWAHIKKTPGAQEGRNIHMDASDKLAALTKKKKITMFELTSIVNDHICT